MLAIANLLPLLDSIASGAGVFADACVIVETKAAADRDVISSLPDAQIHADLAHVFSGRVVLVKPSSLAVALQGALLQRALDRHYGGVGGLNRFLEANASRVHWNLSKIGFQIDARNVFPPQTDPVAAYEGTGAGLGLFVIGSDIDTSLYGEAALQVVVDAFGDADRTLAFTLRKYDGSEPVRNVVIPANTLPGATIAIGGVGDRFVGVVNIDDVGNGGTGADRVHVRSVVERNI